MRSGASQARVEIAEAPFGSDLYRQSLVLREALLRTPLGLTLRGKELVDDADSQHFYATCDGALVGTVSL